MRLHLLYRGKIETILSAQCIVSMTSPSGTRRVSLPCKAIGLIWLVYSTPTSEHGVVAGDGAACFGFGDIGPKAACRHGEKPCTSIWAASMDSHHAGCKDPDIINTCAQQPGAAESTRGHR
jgi:hypothetical protein